MTEQQEKKNSRIALLTSIGIHVAVLLLMFFIVAWRPPDPPIPEYGIELNLGFDDQGSGDLQPSEPVGADEVKPEQTEEQKTEETPEAAPQKVDIKTPEEQVATTEDESPVVVKEKKEEVKPVEKPIEKPIPIVEKPKEKPVENPAAVYKPATTKSDGEKSGAAAKQGKPGSQGDDEGKTGDKGDPQGTVDGNAMYGKPGHGGTGPSLEISGWRWDEKPSPDVPNNESGRVVFEIKVDENGDIMGIRTLERSVSAEAEQICKKAVQRLTFSKTGSNVPTMSTGKITFVIRAK